MDDERRGAIVRFLHGGDQDAFSIDVLRGGRACDRVQGVDVFARNTGGRLQYPASCIVIAVC